MMDVIPEERTWPHQEWVDEEWYRCNAHPEYGDGWICPGDDEVRGCANCVVGQMAAEIERLRKLAVPDGLVELTWERDNCCYWIYEVCDDRGAVIAYGWSVDYSPHEPEEGWECKGEEETPQAAIAAAIVVKPKGGWE